MLAEKVINGPHAFSGCVHNNFMNGGQPTEALDRLLGETVLIRACSVYLVSITVGSTQLRCWQTVALCVQVPVDVLVSILTSIQKKINRNVTN